MKKLSILFLSTVISFSIFAKDEVKFGPIIICSFQSKTYEPGKIDIKVYTGDLLNDDPKELSLLYTYPDLNKDIGKEYSFISEFKLKNDIYVGKMTNVNYLVDASLDIDEAKSLLTLTDNGKKHVFNGTCKGN